jgi:hypothetical protein
MAHGWQSIFADDSPYEKRGEYEHAGGYSDGKFRISYQRPVIRRLLIQVLARGAAECGGCTGRDTRVATGLAIFTGLRLHRGGGGGGVRVRRWIDNMKSKGRLEEAVPGLRDMRSSGCHLGMAVVNVEGGEIKRGAEGQRG